MDPLTDRVPEKAWMPLAYLGPVAYYAKLLLHPTIFIECFDHYQKQTYRNRCRIYSANGPLSLVIPVLTGSAHKILVKDTRIDNGRSWKRLHLKGIESAYRSAPFYEFYIDSLLPFYSRDYEFLPDFNLDLQAVLLQLLNMHPSVNLTDRYLHDTGGSSADYRESIHPKKSFSADSYFKAMPYRQVFMERFGFIPNLSIIDLLFNMGPDALEVLRSSIPSLPG
jgi:hypothetical protein